jgi:hypothetical protein
VVATLQPPKPGEFRRAGLPESITVRLVTVRLETGELEVLATNLLDETLYPTAELGGFTIIAGALKRIMAWSKAGWIWRTSAACRPRSYDKTCMPPSF